MNDWVLEKRGFDPKDAASDGNRFLCANGYMGLRGTVEEAGPEEYAAVTLAGVYDQCGDQWREPVNAPYPLSVQLVFDGRPLSAEGAEVGGAGVSPADVGLLLFRRRDACVPLPAADGWLLSRRRDACVPSPAAVR